MAKTTKKNVWTSLDAFGMLYGISTWDQNYLNLKYVRLPNETNIELRHKINNIRRNPVYGISLQDLVNGLSNELLLDEYNVNPKTTFELTREPHPSGLIDVQDIFVYYQPPTESGWFSITPQVWASGYYTDNDYSIPVNSGFIVWENQFYRDTPNINDKTHNYSRLLTILTTLPDLSRIKVTYNVKINSEQYSFTDMSNPLDPNDDEFIYRTAYVSNSGDFLTKSLCYSLADMPSEISGYYFNSNGVAGAKMYKIRDIIDQRFRHKWDTVRNRQSIWDVHHNYSKGVIPSFTDTPFIAQSGRVFSYQNFDGGIEYGEPSLNIRDIDIIVSGNVENWYPRVEPGKFYYGGVSYRLMENPKYIYFDGTSGSTTLPSGIMRWYKTILASSGDYGSSLDSFIYQEHDYKIRYRSTYDVEPTGILDSTSIYRKRSYLTNDMGYEVTLASGEYYIDYQADPPMLYVSGVNDCVFIWDQINVPSGRICDTVYSDLNPLNDYDVSYDKYFLVIGE